MCVLLCTGQSKAAALKTTQKKQQQHDDAFTFLSFALFLSVCVCCLPVEMMEGANGNIRLAIQTKCEDMKKQRKKIHRTSLWFCVHVSVFVCVCGVNFMIMFQRKAKSSKFDAIRKSSAPNTILSRTSLQSMRISSNLIVSIIYGKSLTQHLFHSNMAMALTLNTHFVDLEWSLLFICVALFPITKFFGWFLLWFIFFLHLCNFMHLIKKHEKNVLNSAY